jgi:hypothetical protein
MIASPTLPRLIWWGSQFCHLTRQSLPVSDLQRQSNHTRTRVPIHDGGSSFGVDNFAS